MMLTGQSEKQEVTNTLPQTPFTHGTRKSREPKASSDKENCMHSKTKGCCKRNVMNWNNKENNTHAKTKGCCKRNIMNWNNTLHVSSVCQASYSTPHESGLKALTKMT
jgi:hypothetical protein